MSSGAATARAAAGALPFESASMRRLVAASRSRKVSYRERPRSGQRRGGRLRPRSSRAEPMGLRSQRNVPGNLTIAIASEAVQIPLLALQFSGVAPPTFGLILKTAAGGIQNRARDVVRDPSTARDVSAYRRAGTSASPPKVVVALQLLGKTGRIK